jgi:hypothetical protein
MKPILLSLVFSALALLPVHAADSQDAAINAVLMADKLRAAAMLSANTNALKEILADDFKYTHSTGFLETKQKHIQSYVDGLRYTKFQTTNVVGHAITPDVVVLNGIIDQTKGTNGKMTDYHLLFQAVWRKKGANWQLASLQTAAPPAPAKKP